MHGGAGFFSFPADSGAPLAVVMDGGAFMGVVVTVEGLPCAAPAALSLSSSTAPASRLVTPRTHGTFAPSARSRTPSCS